MGYKNFEIAAYLTVHYLEMNWSLEQMEDHFRKFSRYLSLDKVYIETFRSDVMIEREKIKRAKEFFQSKGIKTSGGITFTRANLKSFESFCYISEKSRQLVREISGYTASLFDEIILDDFYFTNCKCESCVKAKGNRSWPEFRTELMKEVSEELVVKPARKVNPNVNVIIKYPNWYDQYQTTGYNLKDEPGIFDMIYTGTETRDPEYTQQHLQSYLSYFLMRYMENVKPGKNGGGWFDIFDCHHNLGHYVEQANLTLFSKAREVMLFSYELMLINDNDVFLPLAAHAFEKADEFLDKLGEPKGLTCYKPFNSSGEDHLYDYLGMLGIPLEPVPVFPSESQTVLLTETAAKDPEIIEKIQKQLTEGKTVIITTGLLRALQSKGIEDIVMFKYTDKKALVKSFGIQTHHCSFKNYYNSCNEILIPQIECGTNDVWPVIVALDDNNSYPVLMEGKYGKGVLYLFTIPDNFGDLYHYPKEVLNVLRSKSLEDVGVMLDSESRVGLFAYDNQTFIVNSFLSNTSDISITVNKTGIKLIDIVGAIGNEIEYSGIEEEGKTTFKVNFLPMTYKVFRYE